ncbi:hypothetical protein SEMRO_3060_G342960.1 [Seminavis robusta]|uniref:Uncharacterized protein n=1 Tax=Seminavis robusta TaxID=568900 RepID=A0A9N8HZQ6_9STRA|nr:hypothetical protein SEMRO_3060_G342960.1 [Seminavis robusta]|eukprot:Sro3060_g342960.1 n/a (165) ;mRNA; f:1780-2426
MELDTEKASHFEFLVVRENRPGKLQMNQTIAQLEEEVQGLEYGMDAVFGLLQAALGSKSAAEEAVFNQWRKRLPMMTPKKVAREAMADNTLACSKRTARATQNLFNATVDLVHNSLRDEDPRHNREEAKKVVTGCMLQLNSNNKRVANGAFQSKRATRRRNDNP